MNELPTTVNSGDSLTAELFNLVLAKIRDKIDKVDPAIPKFDEQMKVFIVGG